MSALFDHLSAQDLKGALTQDRPMADLSWLKTGGPAEVLFQPADTSDLQAFLAALPQETPLLPIGVCSNLIIRDGGIEGAVLRLGRGFNSIEILGEGFVRAGAGALDAHVARKAAEAGVDLSFLRTIPGAIGGAVAMNAGCYGTYIADVFVSAEVTTRAGETLDLGLADMEFAYRSSAVTPDWVVTSVVLRGAADEPAAIEARMAEALEARAQTQPVDDRSCGSTFRNPAGHSSTGRADDTHEMKAWKLIEEAGLRGYSQGGAQMSPKHPNFLINTGTATAADLENLGEYVRNKVYEKSSVQLEWEIRRVGQPAQSTPSDI